MSLLCTQVCVITIPKNWRKIWIVGKKSFKVCVLRDWDWFVKGVQTGQSLSGMSHEEDFIFIILTKLLSSILLSIFMQVLYFITNKI